MKAYKKALSDQSDSYLQVHRAFVDKALGFAEGQRGILTNGRVRSGHGLFIQLYQGKSTCV